MTLHEEVGSAHFIWEAQTPHGFEVNKDVCLGDVALNIKVIWILCQAEHLKWQIL